MEVKGPGDSLSCKQKLWLQYLQQIGLRAEVCIVKGMFEKQESESKKIRKNFQAQFPLIEISYFQTRRKVEVHIKSKLKPINNSLKN